MAHEDIKSKLLPFQLPHISNLYKGLQHYRGVLDGSDTGTGKTYVACGLAKALNTHTIIITPLNAKTQWQRTLEYFDVENYYLNNIDQFRVNKTEYIKRYEYPPEAKKPSWKKMFETSSKCQDALIIVDEAHSLKNYKTQNGQMINAFYEKTNAKFLFLSATMAETPLDLSVVGGVLGLYGFQKFYSWINSFGVYKQNYERGFKYIYNPTKENNERLHQEIYGTYKGSRIKKSETKQFMECHIIAEPVDVPASIQKQIKEHYTEINKLIYEYETLAEETQNPMTKILRERQKIELLKVAVFLELLVSAREEGNSVVVFLNFKESIHLLSELLKKKKLEHGLITGEVKGDDREQIKNNFQNNYLKILLVTTGAGGQSIDLHDVHGDHPRYTLISCSYVARELKQALGRVDRANAKTQSTQRIVFIANTHEDNISRKLKRKIKNIDEINDSTLMQIETNKEIQWI